MNRQDAYTEMQRGKKIAHHYFAEGEYYHMPDFPTFAEILAEDGVNHTDVFWSTDGNNFRKDGWEVISK